jgi:tetrahydromethanopterin:alpha-L-glutamate ligase
MHIALAIDAMDWHARALLRAFATRRAEPHAVRLGHCIFDTAAPYGLRLPGFADSLPDAVLVRAVSGGSFEEVTRRLGILHALRELGVPVWNDARAIERCVDKSTTSFFLMKAELPTPRTWAVEGLDAARVIAVRESRTGKLVLKPLFGAQGRGLRLIERPEDLPPPTEVAGVYYLQRYIPPSGTGFADQRLFVCDGELVGAMTRRSSHWVTNIGRGAAPEALTPSPALADLALRAAASVGAHFAGVDLLQDQTGQTFVLEVNSMPAWRGLQKVTPVSIADHVVGALLRRLG